MDFAMVMIALHDTGFTTLGASDAS
jgi:hypothetical protein